MSNRKERKFVKVVDDGNLEDLQKLLSEGVNVNATDPDNVTDVGQWTKDDVGEWLKDIGSQYEKYVEIFKSEGINGRILLECVDEETICEFVERKFHRKVILRYLEDLRKTAAVLTSDLLTAPSVRTNTTTSGDERYRYTDEEGATGVLTKEQRDFYEHNGFLVIRGLLGSTEISKYQDRFEAICDGKLPRHPTMIVMKDVALVGKDVSGQGERVITKIQNWEHDDVLMSYAHDKNVLKYVSAFTGNDIKSVHSMLINKPPDVGKGTSRHPLHQDLWYFPFRPADRIVCAWTAMQTINRENGCLSVLPGTHARAPGGKLLQHSYPDWEGGVNHLYHGVDNFKDLNLDRDLVHLEMECGDCVFFHPTLIHGSGMNRSKGFRKAISIHYSSTHCYYIDLKETGQESVAIEFEKMVEKKFGMPIPYVKQASMKMRLVQGQEDTL